MHAHCDDEQTVLASKSVHCEVEVHPLPITAEREKYKYDINNQLYHEIFLPFYLSVSVC